ncbi:MAG: ATP-binding cassette domain-containing protein [Clostridia bacterium]|nr:ATP-binding cassette domain-containing protein [Clostridia bacterium]MDD4387445.1 ATP-binding cassette domain-containing protein [Clostridia bacterium]
MLISVQNLNKEFKLKVKQKGIKAFFKPVYINIKAVKDVSFEIEKGEVVAFIGPNGAGKSTTIKMLTGIIQPTSGSISVSGFNPCEGRKKLAYEIGCMFGQKSQLYLHLSVIDSFRLLGSIYDMDKMKIQSRISYVAKLFKIEHLLELTVRKLSLGQRMICEIAACILHEPKIIFLDEPTIGLDIIAKLRIREIISMLSKEQKTTIFLTSHDVGDVEALCNRIIVINEGMVITDSSIEDIRNKYLSKKLITMYYDQDITNLKFNYDVVSRKENQVIIAVDTTKEKVGDILSYFTSVGSIADIQIESTPLEDVIRKIYEKRYDL